ncbi:MAG TPA: O-antigen ligase family protein, partial [Bryobacteraceae bacterium]
LLAAVYLVLNLRTSFRFSLAFACPLLMCLYGLGQTVWSNQKIVFNGLEKSCFWLSAAFIAFIATQIFQKRNLADDVRNAIAAFGSFEALLSLLEQASHTGSYFWLFRSGFPDIFGTFAYYNNFAQLIELTLPVTLWEGVRHRSVRLPYLVLAAVQVGAVVSSSSRAGAVLVLGELFVVLLAASLKRRNSISLPVVALALTLSFAFTFVAGFHQVVEKLERPDQLANRRYLNESSLHMIQTRPLTGWGLGAYVPVYKMFALYDDGTWVNQAHNDYLEWAAEGGIPYALVMVLLIVWTIRPAFRSVWGIGLVAFALHAFVDYPFARLGTCGWYFALAGMLGAQQGTSTYEHRRKQADFRELANAELSELAPLT